MSEDEEFRSSMLDKWASRLAGAVAATFGILAFFSSNEGLWRSLLVAIGGGLGAAFII
jgi:hypothetical protein